MGLALAAWLLQPNRRPPYAWAHPCSACRQLPACRPLPGMPPAPSLQLLAFGGTIVSLGFAGRLGSFALSAFTLSHAVTNITGWLAGWLAG